ncbi:MAG: hypothetical protein J6Y82_12495 [Bacteroidales bacterium]|nr:hypothetical protein [Bacteroidales bacterium]
MEGLLRDNRNIEPQINGVVLHILIQKQDRRGEMANGIEVDEFKDYCSEMLRKNTNIISNVATNAVIGVFLDNGSEDNAELKATSLAHEIREKLYKYRKKGVQLILKACITKGKVIIGSSLGGDEYEVLGNAVNSSFQLLDSTHPMQISITRKIKQRITDDFNIVTRRPVDIGFKRAQLYYLHTPKSEVCTVPQNF